MDNIKKIIIVIIFVALILSISILVLVQHMLNDSEIDSITEEEINYQDYQGEYITDKNINKITTKKRYYSMKKIVDDYIAYLTNEEIGSDALYEILGSEYKTEFGITKENVVFKFSKYAGTQIYIEEMYELEMAENIKIVIVNGITKSGNMKFQNFIKLDSSNKTFAIYPEEFLNKYGYTNVEKMPEIKNINLETIDKKTYNTYTYKEISDSEMCKNYLEDYIYNVTTNIEKAYNLLDVEYREKRFGGIDAYRGYVNSNLESLKNAKVTEYTTVKGGNYKQYVCIDNEGRYYLFRETAIMEYTLLLDTYTVVLPEFQEKYNSASTQQKVALNINNFVQAINDKNFNYAYNILNETFRTNKFGSVAAFETYIKNNLFDENDVEFGEFTSQGSTYVYTLWITDAESEAKNKIGLTVIMELGNGTDFKMSFSIN